MAKKPPYGAVFYLLFGQGGQVGQGQMFSFEKFKMGFSMTKTLLLKDLYSQRRNRRTCFLDVAIHKAN